MTDYTLGVAEAVRQGAEPMAEAFEAITYEYSDRPLRALEICYRRDSIEIKFPVGLRVEIVGIITRKFSDAGWGFSTNRTPDDTVRAVTLLMPGALTRVVRRVPILPDRPVSVADARTLVNEFNRRHPRVSQIARQRTEHGDPLDQ